MNRKFASILFLTFLGCVMAGLIACNKDDADKKTPGKDDKKVKVEEKEAWRRKEKTAWKMLIKGQIHGKGSNSFWGRIPEIGKVNLGKSSYNTYFYVADIDVHVHVNTERELKAEYVFNKVMAQEMISDREIKLNLKLDSLPPFIPTRVTIGDKWMELIENQYKQLSPVIPEDYRKMIESAGQYVAFRTPELDELQDTALGLEGKKVVVVKRVGSTNVQGQDGFTPTRKQREFIERLSLTADIDLFPENMKPGDKHTASGDSLGFVFDPLMPGEFRGPVKLEYDQNIKEEGEEIAVLKIRNARIQFLADDDTNTGKFDGWGEMRCLMPNRLIKKVDMKGTGELKGLPKKHLLYGMQ